MTTLSTDHPPTPTRVPWTPVLVHIGITIALTFALSAPFLVGPVDPELIGAVVPVAMMLPLLVSLVTNKLWRQGPIRQLWAVRRSGIARWLGVAVVVMLGVPIMQLVVGMLVGVTDWSPRAGLLTAVLATPLVLLTQGLFAAGEELGWRGYLQTLLAPLRFWPMALFLSLVWMVFHAPAALALLASGEGWTPTVLYLADIFVIGLVFSGLRARSLSVWPAVLAHGLLNSGRVLVMQNFTTPELELSATSQWGLHAIGWVLFAGVAAWLARGAGPR